MTWQNTLIHSITQFEIENPDALQQFKETITSDNALEDENIDLYNKVTKPLVEPDVYLNSPIDEEFYRRSEEDPLFFNSAVQYLEDQRWKYVVEVLNDNGY